MGDYYTYSCATNHIYAHLTGNLSLPNLDVPSTDGTEACGSSSPAKPALMAWEPRSNTMLGSPESILTALSTVFSWNEPHLRTYVRTPPYANYSVPIPANSSLFPIPFHYHIGDREEVRGCGLSGLVGVCVDLFYTGKALKLNRCLSADLQV